MTVISDNGVNRCLRFAAEKDGWHLHFVITTWPNYLCVSGDMGCFVFTRLYDMFEFFRSSSGKLSINPQYWAEKVEAQDRRTGGIDEYDANIFRAALRARFDNWDFASKAEKKECWKEIEQQVLSAENEYEAFSNASNFKYGEFDFPDFYESRLRKYTYHFLWCCFAIAWAIKQYDAQSASVENSKEKITA